jgi:hypothetical protein
MKAETLTYAEEQACLYFEIGFAMTQWAHVERSILDVIFAAQVTTNFNALGHGYFSIENFRSKLAFADEMISKALSEPAHLDTWSKLLRRCRDTSKLRNALAHYRMMGYPDEQVGRRYVLTPRLEKPGEARKANGLITRALGLKAIHDHRLRFFELFCDLDDFAHVLSGKTPRDGAPRAPAQRLEIVELRDSLRSMMRSGEPST